MINLPISENGIWRASPQWKVKSGKLKVAVSLRDNFKIPAEMMDISMNCPHSYVSFFQIIPGGDTITFHFQLSIFNLSEASNSY